MTTVTVTHTHVVVWESASYSHCPHTKHSDIDPTAVLHGISLSVCCCISVSEIVSFSFLQNWKVNERNASHLHRHWRRDLWLVPCFRSQLHIIATSLSQSPQLSKQQQSCMQTTNQVTWYFVEYNLKKTRSIFLAAALIMASLRRYSSKRSALMQKYTLSSEASPSS